MQKGNEAVLYFVKTDDLFRVLNLFLLSSRMVIFMKYVYSEIAQSMKPSAIREIFKSLSDPEIISFAAGNPSDKSFPVEALKKLADDIFTNSASSALQYSVTEGYVPLRNAVSERLCSKFNIKANVSEVLITSGGQQGLELACRALCNKGDDVICENPSFIGALNAFRASGANTVGVDIEDDGINIEKLEETIKDHPRAKLLYVIPTFQNPTGITTSLEKRKKIYDLALKYGLIILEDNPYGELSFENYAPATIKSIDSENIVIYCSSFSKILSAGMRIGFVAAPEEIISKMVVFKQCEDVHSNIFFQMLCHKYICEYDLDSHIKGIRELYRNKCRLMLSCLEEEMPEGFVFTRPEGGLFISLTLPDNVDMLDFVSEALKRKVAVVPGSTFMCSADDKANFVRLNYSTPSDDDIVRGIKLLGETARSY